MGGYDVVSDSDRVSVISVIPGTGSTSLGKAVDDPAGNTDVGIPALVVRKDTPAALTPADGDYTRLRTDSQGMLWIREYYAPAYEDNTNAVAKVEQRFTNARATADTLVKSGAGFLHTVTISATTATPTAGLVTIYDNTSKSGTALYTEWVFATDVGHSVVLDCSFATGLYIGYDATLANASVTVSYR